MAKKPNATEEAAAAQLLRRMLGTELQDLHQDDPQRAKIEQLRRMLDRHRRWLLARAVRR